MHKLNHEQQITIQIIGDLSKRFNSFVIPDSGEDKLQFINLWVESGKEYSIFDTNTYLLYLDFITNFWAFSTPPSSRQVFEWIFAAKTQKSVVIFSRNLKSRYGSGWRNDVGFEYSLCCAMLEQGLLNLDFNKLLANICNHPNYATFAPNVNQVVQCALMTKYSDVAPVIQKTFRKVLDPKSELYNNPLIAETRRRIGTNVIKNTQENALKKIFLDAYHAVLVDYNSGVFIPKEITPEEKENKTIDNIERRENASFFSSLKHKKQ